jgi:hypothetical protein
LLWQFFIKKTQIIETKRTFHQGPDYGKVTSITSSLLLRCTFHPIYKKIAEHISHLYDVEPLPWLNPKDKKQCQEACNDIFIAEYVSGSNFPGIDTHRDGADFGFVIKLNSNTVGGGTWYASLDSVPFHLEIGDVTLHPSFLAHAGFPVTEGTRYIIGGFVNVKPAAHVRPYLIPSVKAKHAAIEKEAGHRCYTLAIDQQLAGVFLGRS